MRAIKTTLSWALIIVMMTAGAGMSQVIPTPEWTQFGSLVSTVSNELVPVGSIVRGYDQSGVLCGEDIVTEAGKYSMAVYGDDPFSTSVDEGCELNEAVVFRINGIVADKLGPSDGLWVGKGPIKSMELSIVQSFAVSLSSADEGLGLAGTTVIYSVFVNNDGNGTDRFLLSAASSKGWTVTDDAPDGGFYVGAGESEEFNVSVQIPAGATVGEQDILTVSVVSQFDGTNTDTKNITTTVDTQTSVDENDYVIPGEFRLKQNFPNPFNPETNISFNLERSTEVSLEVFNILGRRQATLFSGYLGAGEHTFTWRGVDAYGRQAASGIYFYRLTSNEYSLTRKMTLLK